MTIWNKILIGLIFVASLGFFYMSVRTLKTHQYWRDLVRAFEDQIEAAEQERLELLHGNGLEGEGAQMGIEATRSELYRMLIERGRVWYNCAPQQADRETGQVSVTTDEPRPHGITDKMILYVFEEEEITENAHYIGEFKVVGVADQQVQLQPTRKLIEKELDRLVKSEGTWSLYEKMPADNHDVFAQLTEEEKREFLPEGSVSEFIKDGQPAEAEDPKERLSEDGKTYVRRLRDYKVLFSEYHRKRTYLHDLRESAERDVAALETAVAAAGQLIEARQADVVELKKELVKYRRERDAAVAHHAALQRQVTAAEAAVEKMIVSNKAIAGRIAKIQLEAVRRIDQRTRRMAQGSAAGN